MSFLVSVTPGQLGGYGDGVVKNGTGNIEQVTWGTILGILVVSWQLANVFQKVPYAALSTQMRASSAIKYIHHMGRILPCFQHRAAFWLLDPAVKSADNRGYGYNCF